MEAAPDTGRKRIKDLEAMVADVILETPDTATLVLFTGNERLEYRPGHFLTVDPHQFLALERFTSFLEDQKGKKEPPRAYSLSSAPHEKRIAFTVKEERYVRGQTKYPPLLSPLLVRRLPRGTPMQITGFTGPYFMSDDIEEKTEHVVHICAGSGIVPNFSMIKSNLVNGRKLRHTLLYSNKTKSDVIFWKDLDALQKLYPDRLKIIHSLTRESDDSVFSPDVIKGRLTKELVKRAITDVSADYIFMCGPAISPWDRKAAKEAGTQPTPRFLETSLEYLAQLGVPRNHILHESYG